MLNSGFGSALSLGEGKEEGHAMNDSRGYSRLCSDGKSQPGSVDLCSVV